MTNFIAFVSPETVTALEKRVEVLEALVREISSGPEWLTMAQAAERLNLERKTVRKLIDKGDIQAKQGLRKIEISSKSILEYNLKHTIR